MSETPNRSVEACSIGSYNEPHSSHLVQHIVGERSLCLIWMFSQPSQYCCPVKTAFSVTDARSHFSFMCLERLVQNNVIHAGQIFLPVVCLHAPLNVQLMFPYNITLNMYCIVILIYINIEYLLSLCPISVNILKYQICCLTIKYIALKSILAKPMSSMWTTTTIIEYLQMPNSETWTHHTQAGQIYIQSAKIEAAPNTSVIKFSIWPNVKYHHNLSHLFLSYSTK